MKYKIKALFFTFLAIFSVYANEPTVEHIEDEKFTPRLVRAFLLAKNPRQLHQADALYQDLRDLFILLYELENLVDEDKDTDQIEAIEAVQQKIHKLTEKYGSIWHVLLEASEHEVAQWYIVYNYIFELYRTNQL